MSADAGASVVLPAAAEQGFPLVQRVGMFGGAFDPPHVAHRELAEWKASDREALHAKARGTCGTAQAARCLRDSEGLCEQDQRAGARPEFDATLSNAHNAHSAFAQHLRGASGAGGRSSWAPALATETRGNVAANPFVVSLAQ